MKNKKILIYALIVLILAGIIVTLLKGFNVDINLRAHESLNYTIGKDFDMKDVKQIAKEVFGSKKYEIRTIELFDDAVCISALEINEDEKNSLIEKLDAKFEIEPDEDRQIEIISKPGVRIREIIKPYIMPSSISFVLIYIIYLIRFYKKNSKIFKTIVESILEIILMNLSILSLIVICRIPISMLTIPILLIISIVTLILYFEKKSFSKH